MKLFDILLKSKYLHLLIFIMIVGCKPQGNKSQTKGHFINGELFAYGVVHLTATSSDSKIKIKKQTSVNNLDSQGIYKLVDEGGEEVVYVDYLPQERRPVIYSSQIITRVAAENDSKLNIWFKLKRSSPSYSNQNTSYVYVGSAELKSGEDSSEVQLFSKATLAQIQLGTSVGALALHYADSRIYGKKYDRSFCLAAFETPERQREEITGGYNPIGCSSIQRIDDICQSNPSDPLCQPEMPEKLSKLVSIDDSLRLVPLNLVEVDESEHSFRLVGDENTAEIKIISEGRDNSGKGCEDFNISVRDNLNKLSGSCSARIDSGASLRYSSCLIKLSFSKNRSYEDKVCHVVAHDLKTDKTDVVQILSR